MASEKPHLLQASVCLMATVTATRYLAEGDPNPEVRAVCAGASGQVKEADAPCWPLLGSVKDSVPHSSLFWVLGMQREQIGWHPLEEGGR